MSDQLAKLDEQIEQLKQKKRRLQQRQAAAERKKDTRRKILLGSLLQELVASGENGLNPEWLQNQLNPYLTRNADRQLFDLPLLEKEPKETEQRESV